jgi:hypothetical protein
MKIMRFNKCIRQILFFINMSCLYKEDRQNSSVGTEEDYELDGRGSITCWGTRISSFTQSPNRLYGPTDLLSNKYCWFFFEVKEARGVKVASDFNLLQRTRMICLYVHSLMHLNGCAALLIKNKIGFTFCIYKCPQLFWLIEDSSGLNPDIYTRRFDQTISWRTETSNFKHVTLYRTI